MPPDLQASGPEPSPNNPGSNTPPNSPAPVPHSKPPIDALLWTIKEAAEALRVSVRTCKRLAAVLPPGIVVRVGRRRLFSKADLIAWVNAGCPEVHRPGARPNPRPERRRLPR
jgi:hypothetical protein